MPGRRKIDIEKIRASQGVGCIKCGYTIPPWELRRIDGNRVRCPKCGAAFEPEKKDNGKNEIGFS